MMNSINYSQLNTSSNFFKKGLCLGKTKSSYFLGPILSKHLCSHCVYLRISSSISDKIDKFIRLSKEEENFLIQFSLRKKVMEKIQRNSVIEIRNKEIYFMHYVMPVPGCNHQSYEKQ